MKTWTDLSGGVYGLVAEFCQHKNGYPGSIRGGMLENLSLSRETLRYELLITILCWTLSTV
jgi:hypothetical protein